MTRYVLIGCTHGLHDHIKIPEGDVLIHTGDFCGNGTRDEVDNFFEWLDNLPHAVKIVTAGNHDGAIAHGYRPIINDPHTHFLLHESVYIPGIGMVFGTPMSPSFNDWDYMADTGTREILWRDITPHEIIVSHAPPKNIGDTVDRNGYSAGCEHLRFHIDTFSPALVVCSHIHEARGVYEHENGFTTIVNASNVNLRLTRTLPATVIDLP